MIVLEPTRVDEIIHIGRDRAPSEACGVLLPTPYRGQWVWEMPNRSHTPHDSFELHTEDIQVELAEWILAASLDEMRQVAIWHTHPGGNVGPSRTDLHNRIDGFNNLVISLGDEPKATWY